MPQSEPRKHHIVPSFYLAGFTPTDSANGALQVFDYATAKRYQSTPKKACRETDFYRVEEPGLDPHDVEKVLGWHEGGVAPFVKAVARGTVADKRQVGETLALAASIAARSRRGRKQLEIALALRLRTAMRMGEVSPEQWEHLRTVELASGATDEQVPTYDDAQRRLSRGEWIPRAPPSLTVALIPEAQDKLLKSLQNRHWELHATDSTRNGGFISSDSPLVWGDLDEIELERQPPLTDYDIEITFPVSRNAALVSHPGARDATCQATDEVVAHVNRRTLQLSMGLIFHAEKDFQLRRGSGEIRRGSEYYAYVADARRRGILRP
jgi:Protein of unknown function (DUF4238)